MAKNGSEIIENYPGTRPIGNVLYEIEKEALPVKLPRSEGHTSELQSR